MNKPLKVPAIRNRADKEPIAPCRNEAGGRIQRLHFLFLSFLFPIPVPNPVSARALCSSAFSYFRLPPLSAGDAVGSLIGDLLARLDRVGMTPRQSTMPALLSGRPSAAATDRLASTLAGDPLQATPGLCGHPDGLPRTDRGGGAMQP